MPLLLAVVHGLMSLGAILLLTGVGDVHDGAVTAGEIGAFRWFLYGALPLLSAGWLALAWCCWRWEPSPGEEAILAVVVAAVMLAALVLPPVFSDDIYRYVWEGAVIAAGESPYVYAPSAPELAPLAAEWPRVHPRINNPDLTAIYPPLPQLLFAAVAALGGGLFVVRLLMVLLVLAVLMPVMRAHAIAAGRPRGRVYTVLLLPLVWMEAGVAGHLDVLLAVGAAVLLFGAARGSGSLAGVGVAVSILGKLAPVVFLPHLLRGLGGWRERSVAVAVAIALVVMAYLPFLGSGERLFQTVDTYGKVWESNGFVYPLVLDGLSWMDPEGAGVGTLLEAVGLRGWALEAEGFAPLHPNLFGARGLSLLIYAAIWVIALVGPFRIETRWLLVVGGGLLVAPVVHPWYLLALLPAMVRGGALAAAAAWWSIAIPFTYAVLPGWWDVGVWEPPGWPWWLQYGGLVAVGLGVATAGRLLHQAGEGAAEADGGLVEGALPTAPCNVQEHAPQEQEREE